MATTTVFDTCAKEYDQWFDDHEDIYLLELEAIRTLLPETGEGVEIGAGTGRFTKPLGVKLGIEPSAAMREIAIERGINVIAGTADPLPLDDNTYGYALMVTTVCFLESLEEAFNEVYRILKTGGCILIGFIEKESVLGKQYEKKKNESKFYKDAHFHTTEEILQALINAGFNHFEFSQAVLPGDIEPGAEPIVEKGQGKGSFIVLRGKKAGDS